MYRLNDIIERYNIVIFDEINSGWSGDEKFYFEDPEENKYIVKISSKKLYDKRIKQFNKMRILKELKINSCMPIEFGGLDDNSNYSMFSYIEGEDACEYINKIDDKEAYRMGFEAGHMLFKLHEVKVDKDNIDWWDLYNKKYQEKIDNFNKVKSQLRESDLVLNFYKNNLDLMKDRPLTYCHGDYHLGNMIVQNKRVYIIDFDKSAIADPYDDFKPFAWNAIESEYFQTGLVNGYFKNKIADDFFEILRFYASEAMISNYAWAHKFGLKEKETAIKVYEYILDTYDKFELLIPKWYKGVLNWENDEGRQ